MDFYSRESFEPAVSLGYLAKRIFQASRDALEEVFAPEQLTFQQWSALVSIYFGRGATCIALARELGHDAGATTRLIDGLEQRGLLRRERDAQDRRVVNLSLTEAGSAAAERCRARVVERWNEWLEGWSRAEIEQLIGSLQRLWRTIDPVAAGAML